MSRLTTNVANKRAARTGRWILAAALLAPAWAALPGCSSLDFRGESFAKDSTFDWSGRLRQPDEQVELSGFSNKARQIERDFGAR
jgi:hypothetical protein